MDKMDERTWEMIQQYAVPAVTVLLIILIAFLVAAWLSRMVTASCNRANLDATLGKFFGRAVRWIILLIAALFVLSEFGIETASFAVILGAAGLAIGLAFQGTLSNFSAGIMLLAFRPFKVGDVVNVAGQLGIVDEIELFTTQMDTFDKRRIILPNSAVFGATIENITYHPFRRIDVSVGTEYSADLDKTREVLEQAAADVPGRRDDPAPAVFLMGLGASSVDWQVRVWADGDVFGDVKQAAIRQVKVALDEAGIGIPFPQMDVHVDQSSADDKD